MSDTIDSVQMLKDINKNIEYLLFIKSKIQGAIGELHAVKANIVLQNHEQNKTLFKELELLP